jgi:uncharacterized hydrophobic protein (TIGR00271 family)
MAQDVKVSPVAEDVIYHHEDFRLSAGDRDALYRRVLEASRLDPEFLTMLGLSALIALLGLLQNSTAVIIGAMLISPLMDPILAAALALVLGDWRLGRKTAIILGLSIGGAVVLTVLVASLIPLRQATPEILARTNPNLLDLFIAFLSGLAGTLALRSGSAGLMVIPGVAIAVAVIPPLAVVGYAVSAGQGVMAGGAFLLFITNLVAIIISAAIVFILVGYRPHEADVKGHLKLRYRIAISAVVLAVLSIPLVQTLRRAVGQVRIRSEVVRILDSTFATENSSVDDLRITQRRGELQVRATVRTTEYFDQQKIFGAEERLRGAFGPQTHLEVEQILVAHGGLSPQQISRIRNFITGGVVQPATPFEETAFDARAAQDRLLGHFQKQLDDVLAGSPVKRQGGLRAELGGRPVTFYAELGAPEPLEPQTLNLLASQLSSRLTFPARLKGRAELQGADYVLALGRADERQGLAEPGRQAIQQLARLVSGRSDLHLHVTLSYVDRKGEAADEEPALWRHIKAALARSGLSPEKVSIETVRHEPGAVLPWPPPGMTVLAPPGTPAEAQLPAVVRAEFKVIQEF